jgi:hypothetical protein
VGREDATWTDTEAVVWSCPGKNVAARGTGGRWRVLGATLSAHGPNLPATSNITFGYSPVMWPPSSAGSRSTRTSGLALAHGLALLGVTAVGCGRIPGLYDAAIRAPTDPRGDGSLAIADVLLDTRKLTDGVDGAEDAGSPETGDSTTSCGEVVVSVAARVPADVLLVVDRSGSMYDSIDRNCSCDPTANPKVVCADTSDCRTRWASLVTALDTALSSTPFLHWGLKLFASPDAGSCAVTDGVEVPIGGDTITAIQTQIAATKPAGETPTAAAITAATAYLKTQVDTSSKVILLATDGDPNCGGSPPSVYDADVAGATDAITTARDAGFLVYVIGIGSSVGNLDAFARAGGSGSYYPGQSPEEITHALASISKAATCTFALASLPPDPTAVAVYLDKEVVPQDASNGWSFGANAQTVLLHGGFCDQALSDTASVVQVLFGCGQPLPPVLP